MFFIPDGLFCSEIGVNVPFWFSLCYIWMNFFYFYLFAYILKDISCRQHVVGSCFLNQSKIHIYTVTVFKSLAFDVIMNLTGLKFIILLLLSYICSLFLFCPFLPSFMLIEFLKYDFYVIFLYFLRLIYLIFWVQFLLCS